MEKVCYFLCFDAFGFEDFRKSGFFSDGPYGIFAGRDASRGLGTFVASAEAIRDTYDDLADLTPSELEGMREWAAQFSGKSRFFENSRFLIVKTWSFLEKYPVVGRLLKPGDVPEIYSDDEEAEAEGEKSESMSGSLTASTTSSIGSEDKKDD